MNNLYFIKKQKYFFIKINQIHSIPRHILQKTLPAHSQLERTARGTRDKSERTVGGGREGAASVAPPRASGTDECTAVQGHGASLF